MAGLHVFRKTKREPEVEHLDALIRGDDDVVPLEVGWMIPRSCAWLRASAICPPKFTMLSTFSPSGRSKCVNGCPSMNSMTMNVRL